MSTSPVRDGGAPIAPPQRIGHLLVVGAIPEQSGKGERCHKWIVMVYDAERPAGTDYGTLQVGCGGPGAPCAERFVAVAGHYDMSWQEAAADMIDRARVPAAR